VTFSKFLYLYYPSWSFLQGKLPILVGGTCYYAELVLFKSVFQDYSHDFNNNITEPENSNKPLYEKLKELDPVMAQKLHPNNIRKIQRALEVIKETGKFCSILHHYYFDYFFAGTLYSKFFPQQFCNGDTYKTFRRRFSSTCVIWLDTNLSFLDDQLNNRIDKMLELGLVKELLFIWKNFVVFSGTSGLPLKEYYRKFKDMNSSEKSCASHLDELILFVKNCLVFNCGALQSIGFKEMSPFIGFCKFLEETQEDDPLGSIT
jgi:hypothetical protein